MRSISGALAVAVLVAVCACKVTRALETDVDAGAAHEAAKKPLRVLFVGNSYTFVNDLPSLVRQLATAAHEELRLEPVVECPGAATLRSHWESGKDVALLQASHFDWMVMQGQSELPSFDHAQLERVMLPYAVNLEAAARARGTKTLLYATWGHRNGDPQNVRGDSYEAMQDRLTSGYALAGSRIHAPIAPVGLAWKRAHAADPTLALWQADGSHPSLAGSYLAACVIYAALFGHGAVGNEFRAGLDAATASALQRYAADAVAARAPP